MFIIMPNYTNIDEYIAQFPTDKNIDGKTVNIREILQNIRQTIYAAAPDATEKISYQMPAFWQNEVLIYFAAMKKHIGIYPTKSGVTAFADRLTEYKTSKGAIQLPLDKPIPYELIAEITRFRLNEVNKSTTS